MRGLAAGRWAALGVACGAMLAVACGGSKDTASPSSTPTLDDPAGPSGDAPPTPSTTPTPSTSTPTASPSPSPTGAPPAPVSALEKQLEETSFHLLDVAFADALVGYAVGRPHWDQRRKAYAGTVVKTTDGGESWHALETGVAVPLQALALVDATHGWVVGAGGALLRTGDGGASWAVQPFPAADDLRCVSFLDASRGWVAGRRPVHFDAATGEADSWESRIWRTTDGGASWAAGAIPPGASLVNGLDFVDAQRGWAVGAKFMGLDLAGAPVHRPVVYRTTDGGETWSEQIVPDRAFVFTHVEFVDGMNGWVTGFMTGATEVGGAVFHTADGGVSWTQQEAGSFFVPLWDVRFVDRLRGYAVGGMGGSLGGAIYRTLDGGLRWTRLDDLPRYDAGFEDGPRAMAVSAVGDQVVVVGDHDVVVKSSRAWGACGPAPATPCGDLYRTSYANVHYRFEDVHFADPLHGWAVGRRSFAPGLTGQTIFHTGDGGATWAEQYQAAPDPARPSSLFGLDAVAFVDASSGWAVGRAEVLGGTPHGAVLHTGDGGLHWTEQGPELAAALAPKLVAVRFLDGRHGWALDGGHLDAAGRETLYLARTGDGGASWQWVSTGLPGSLAAGSALPRGGLAFPDGQHGWAVGGLGIVLHTTDGGATWTRQALPAATATARVCAVAFLDSQAGWIAGEALFKTGDGGATWVDQQLPAPGDLLAVKFPDALRGWVAGEGGAVFRTGDGGGTWTPVPSGTDATLRGSSFVGTQKGWFVGDRGTILAVP